jgi:large subunit ribosomal protein L6
MSRIGKVPVVIPEKVSVTVAYPVIKVKGPKGELSFKLHETTNVEVKEGKVLVSLKVDSLEGRSQWGTARTQISNMVTGVSTGFTKSLEFNGVGYKASVQGAMLTLSLGYSHVIEFPLPVGITAKVVKNVIDIEGSNKNLIGDVAAKIRSFREPEPYKGKGVRYIDEKIKRKAGKSGGKGK